MKPILSSFISGEQFGFLKDRQILDAIGITQEVIHTIKQKKLKALLLKIDLEKTYDRVDWVFFCLILIQIGIPSLIIRWIMACVSTASIAVLISGAPSKFFKISRGVQQGCPLSLLFLLIIEGLSRLIGVARADGSIQGIKFAAELSHTHSLFVDDVLLAGLSSVAEW